MSKLAWHFQGIPDWARQGWINSQYVKLIDPPSDNPFPNAKVIGRIYIPDNETNDMIWMGAEGANAWLGTVIPIMLSRPYVHIWELPNEPQPVDNPSFCTKLSEFTRVAAMDIADVPAVNTTVSTVYVCRMKRVAASSDDYGSAVYMMFNDSHIIKDALGSAQEYIK